MNKTKFRVIFNRTLSRLVVTSELAKTADKSSPVGDGDAVKSAVRFCSVLSLSSLSFRLFCALGFVSFLASQPAFANLEIRADKTAPVNQQPVILSTANGIPQVNIQTPNSKGLSHNKYAQFDVAEKGAILNNSRTTVQTQQGGLVTGNPYLARGEARVILNEVNAANPSQLRGYVEVAGKKADVIIANPSGIHCDGCGVINSGRTTLTTGKPQIQAGQVTGFDVEKGKVKVSGKGLDNSRVDYTEILAREAEINAGIWSNKKLTVITGENQIQRSETAVTPNDDDHLKIIHTKPAANSTPQPEKYAVDVSELGGMYAGKIYLIGTEQGLGVRNAGHIGASAGNIELTTSGQLMNKSTGNMTAQANISLTAIDDIQNQGIISAQQKNRIKTDRTFHNKGTGRVYGEHIAIRAKKVVNTENKTDAGKTTAAVIAAREHLAIGATEILNQSQYTKNGEMGALIYSDGELVIGERLNFNDEAEGRAQILSNQGATIESRGAMALSVDKIENLNVHFKTERKIVSDKAVDWSYYVPEGVSEQAFRIDAANLKLTKGVRGKTRYKWRPIDLAHLVKPKNGDIKSNFLPPVMICTEDCVLNHDNMYLPKDSAWAFFNIELDGDSLLMEKLSQADLNLFDERVKKDYIQWQQQNKKAFEQLQTAIEAHNAVLKGQMGREFKNVWVTKLTKEVIHEEVVTETQPGNILSGGDMFLLAGSLLNDKSQIITGGKLSAAVAHLQNIEALGEREIEQYGHKYYSYEKKRKSKTASGRTKYRRETASHVNGLVSTLTETIRLPVTQYKDDNYNANAKAQTDIGLMTTQSLFPNSSFFRVNEAADSHVLIETDPNFTRHKNWLSSDYMYTALRHDHENTHKRLGDGYYEQRLVREQINRLTGRPFLGNYTDFDSQYRGLMDAGITFAQKFNLRPGISLSPSQVASLTSDIVWLEEETITLEDGSQQKVLVPKVYAVVKEGDLQANGALISAKNLDLNTQELINQGTIAGRDVAVFNANRLTNSGNLSAKIFSANINGDMDNTGNMTAENALLLNVTGNLTHQSTLRTDDVNLKGYAYKNTHLDRKGLLHVKGENGTLQIAAGHLTIAGADIINDGSGTTYLSAQNALNLTALSTAHSENLGSGDHYRHESHQGIAISRVQGKGDVILSGNTIQSEAAQLEADNRLALLAENNITLGTATTSSNLEEHHRYKSGHKVTGTKTKTTFVQDSREIQQGTALSAENIVVQSSQGNVSLNGSQLLAEKDIDLSANNVSITAAQNIHHHYDFEETKKSGFTASLTDTTASVGYEKSKIKNTTDTTKTQALSSALVALSGNVTVLAQDRIRLEGAQLSSGQDMTLQGKSVDILAATESADVHQESYAKSSGLGMKTLYNPFKEAKNNYEANAQKEINFKSWVNNSGQSGQASSNAIIRFTQGISTYAHSTKTQAKSHSHTETAVSGELRAGGNLTLLATDNDITTQGTLLTAEGNATLLAKENIRLGVATHTQTQSAAKKTQGLQWDGTQTADNKIGVHHNRENGQNSLIQDQGTTLSIGGSTRLATQVGDITLKGTTLASQGDVQINTAGNIEISTANTLMSQSENSKLQSVGGIDISPTEKFYGYHRELRDIYGNQKNHQGSQVTSLEGNVTLTAGKDYHQTGSEILSTQNTTIQAQEVLIDAAQDTISSREHNSDLKVGTFARVKSPLLDLLNLVDTVVNTADNASDRTKAANALGLAAKGYTVASTIYNATKGNIDGTLLRAEAGFGVAHSRSNNLIKEAQSQGNTINGKNVTIEATAGNLTAINTNITSNDKNAERMAQSAVNLSAKNNIHLMAGESTQYQQGKQTSAGVEVGTAFSIGAKTGWSIYLNAGYGNSKQKVDNFTHNNTYIDSETVNLQSGKDTHLIGAGVTAKTINVNSSGNLHIESLQDHEYQKQSSQSAGLQLEFGLGSAWSFSLSGSSAKGTARRNQVNEQSGLYAEEGGYHINADNVHLKGGAIASTNAQNSELTTNRFTFEDIRNSSESQATSLSGSVGMSRSSDTLYDKNGKVINNPTRAQYADKSLKREKGDIGLTGGVGIPLHESQSDSSLTKATLTEGRIILNKDSQPTQTTAKALGINTELKNANKQVENTLNLDRTLQEQKAVQTAVANLQEATTTYVDNKRKEAQAEFDKVKQQHDQNSEAYKTAEAAVKAWEIGGKNKQNIDTITAVVSTVLAGSPAEQIAVAALSPTLNNQIHTLTKDDDSKLTNILAHAVLGAIEAKAAGVNGATGAVAGSVSELTAQIIAEKYYGKKGEELTENERQTLSQLSQIAAGIAGGLIGDSSMSAVVGTEVGKRAVENNYLYRQEAEELLNLRLALQLTTNAEEKEKIQTRINELEKLDQDRQEYIKTVCPDFAKSSSACSVAIADAEKAKASYNGWTDQYQPVSYNSKDKRPYTAIFTRDYSRVNEALAGKDDFTIYKEELAKEMAASGNVPLKDAYHIIDTAFALNDALSAVNAVYAGKTSTENLTKLTKIVQKGLNAPVVKNGVKAEIDALQRIGKNSESYNKEINMEISNRRNSHIYNLEAVNNLKNGILPGDALNNKTKLPEEGKVGVPRNMPASTNPDLMAIDFVEKYLGRSITNAEWEAGKSLNNGNCISCFKVDIGDKQTIIYRSGYEYNSSKDTLPGTATVEINTQYIQEINKNKQLKLKFPLLK